MEFFACRTDRTVEGNRYHAPKPSGEPGADEDRIHAGLYIGRYASLGQPAAIANMQHHRPHCRRYRTGSETRIGSRNESGSDLGYVQHGIERCQPNLLYFLGGIVCIRHDTTELHANSEIRVDQILTAVSYPALRVSARSSSFRRRRLASLHPRFDRHPLSTRDNKLRRRYPLP